uniref:Protein kinase domain-containing protein n=1 Tax=Caenorhabditis japonica TaxID=281687 RepID=A0A8R1HXK4_CAEJA
MSDEEDDELVFRPNTEITSKKTTYIVEKLLGEGGFGAVYKVKEVKSGKFYAMKIEKKQENKEPKLKMETNIRQIYILDFGIARQILNDRNELKSPRVTVRFKGTLKFASIACHRGKELGWKDDCESWFYLMLDLIVITGLPWKSSRDINTVWQMKEEVRERKNVLFHGLKCGSELGKILAYLDSLQYQDHIDYHYIYKQLEDACFVSGGKMDGAYDWEL